MNISRRDALLGATAAAVVTGAITVPLAIKAVATKAALGGEPLVALEAKLMEARAAGKRAVALWDAARNKAGDWAFGQPRIDFSNPAMNNLPGWLHSGRIDLNTIKDFNCHTESWADGDLEELARRKAEGRERIRWWIKTRRAQQAAKEAAGIPEAEALLDSNNERVDAIEDQLWDTPAGTLQGVVIRLREAHRDYVAVECSDDSEGDFYADAFGKVLADLERLSEGLPS